MSDASDKRSTVASDDAAEVRQRLHRLLLKLSHIAGGAHPELDEQLAALRIDLREGADDEALQARVDAMTEQVVKGNESAATLEPAELDLESFVIELRRAIRVPQFRAALKNWQQQQQGLEPHSRLTELVELIAGGIQQGEATAAGPGSSSWLRWFKKDSAETPPEMEQQLHLLSDAVRDALRQMLQQLIPPNLLQTQQPSPLDMIELVEDNDQLAALLEESTALMLDATSESRVQFNQFLRELDRQLDKLQQFLSGAAASKDEELQQSEQLNQQLRSEMQGLQSDLLQTTSDDKESLETVIHGRMENILLSLKNFQRQQKEHAHLNQQQITELQTQLQATEAEASRLKEKMMEQRQRALTDPLTGLPNRYAYNDKLQQEFSRWQRYQQPLSLVLADIDHFKNVNDTYGHEAGDAALKAVGSTLKAELRDTDFLARYGGEEFVILLPSTNLADATKAVNKLRQTVQKRTLNLAGQTLVVTLSFGVSEFIGDDQPKDVFSRADRALLRAKSKGRNQVCPERKST